MPRAATPDGRVAREVALAAIRRRQHQLATRSQMLAVGYPRTTIDDRLARGVDETWQRGVIAPAGTPRTFEARTMAALLRLGGTAVVVGLTAARLWRLPDCDGIDDVEVAVPARKVPRLDDRVRVRSYRWLAPEHTIAVGLLATLRPAPLLVDLAARWDDHRLLVAAARLRRRTRILTPDAVAAALAARGACHGAERARRVLGHLDPAFAATRSVAEVRALAHLLGSPLPRPVVNLRVPTSAGRTWEFDLVWPGLRAVVEIDGSHHDPARATTDRAAFDVRCVLGSPVSRVARGGRRTIGVEYEHPRMHGMSCEPGESFSRPARGAARRACDAAPPGRPRLAAGRAARP